MFFTCLIVPKKELQTNLDSIAVSSNKNSAKKIMRSQKGERRVCPNLQRAKKKFEKVISPRLKMGDALFPFKESGDSSIYTSQREE
jgi:hypothetical protein